MLTYIDPWGRPVLTQATTRKTGHPGAEDFVTFGAEDGHFHCCAIWLLQESFRKQLHQVWKYIRMMDAQTILLERNIGVEVMTMNQYESYIHMTITHMGMGSYM